jgi:hypothetical protein
MLLQTLTGGTGQVLQQKLDYYEGAGGLIWQLQEALDMRARQVGRLEIAAD